MKIKLFLLSILIISTLVKGQDNSVLLLADVPQISNINAAYQAKVNWHLAIPLIGNYSMDLYNSGFTWEQFVGNNLSANLQANNTAILESNWQLFGAGYLYRDMYFTLDINQKRKANFMFPSSFMDFTKGNWDYNNNSPINYSTAGVEGYGIDYTEFSLGFSKPVTDIFTFGFRIKYLMGAASIKIENLNIDVNTDRNGDIEVNSETALLFTEIEDVSLISWGPFNTLKYNGKMFNLQGNYGFGLDAGICANLNINSKPLIVGLAINDLGFIKWDNSSIRHEINGDYTIEGEDITAEILGNPSSSFINYWDAIGDSLDVNMTPQKTPENYSTNLQGSFNLTATYIVNDKINLGAYFKSYYLNSTLIPKAGISAGFNYRNVSTTLAYFAAKNSYTNVGVGLSARFKMMQIYTATDNLPALFMPHKTKSFGFRMGINIVSDFSATADGSRGNNSGSTTLNNGVHVSRSRKASSGEVFAKNKKRKRSRNLAYQKITLKKNTASSGKRFKSKR